jgi:TonB C terminal
VTANSPVRQRRAIAIAFTLALNGLFVAAMLDIRPRRVAGVPEPVRLVAVQFLPFEAAASNPGKAPEESDPPQAEPDPPVISSLPEPSDPTIEPVVPPSASDDSAPQPVDATRTLVLRMGQLTARVHAAWAAPADRASQEFHCRVRVSEDDDGAVRRVEWLRCDEDPALRDVLQAALRAASPLPLLDPNADGARTVTLDFAAIPAANAGRRAHVEPAADGP